MGAKNKNQNKTNANNQGKQGGKGGKGGEGAKGNNTIKSEPTQKPAKVGGQQLQIRHILCSKESKAKEAMDLVLGGPGGEVDKATLPNFSIVSKVYNEDKEKLGWKTKGELDIAFVKVAWTLEKSEDGKMKPAIAKTEHGYHVIIVTGQK